MLVRILSFRPASQFVQSFGCWVVLFVVWGFFWWWFYFFGWGLFFLFGGFGFFEARVLFRLSAIFEGRSTARSGDSSSPGLCCFYGDAICYCLDSQQYHVGQVEIKM